MLINDLKNIDFLIELDDNKLFLLEKYQNLTLEMNKVMNLTGNDTPEEFATKNVLDSLLLVKYLNFDIKGKNIVDIGSGAGLPGIPLAIYFPETKFYLLEPIKKRCNFLNKVVEELSLKNVVVINGRAEELVKEKRSFFDVATARAVSSLNILLELSMPLVKIGGFFIAYKGKNYEKELISSKLALNELKTSSKLVVNCVVPNTIGERSFIFFEKKEEISNKYPRSYSLIKKRPL